MFILGGSPLQFYFALFLDWQIWVGWSLALMTTSGRVTVLQKSFADTQSGVSLVIQQLRFPPVSTGHADLMREDPACCGAAKPRVHNYRAQTLKARKFRPLGPYIREPCSPMRELPPLAKTRESRCFPQRPSTAKNGEIYRQIKLCTLCHVWMWELDHKASWAPKNWCFSTVVLEKTVESPLDCKEIQPVHPKGDQSWLFIGRTDAAAETPILWPPDAKNWLTGKDPGAGKDWRREEKGTTEGEMAGWHLQALGVGDGQGGLACCSPWGCKESDMTEWTELKWNYIKRKHSALKKHPIEL